MFGLKFRAFVVYDPTALRTCILGLLGPKAFLDTVVVLF